jgi:DNA polymerase-3 subunit alpha
MERLGQEFQAIGFFLSGHPLDEYETALAKLGVVRFAELEAASERGATAGRVAGIVVSVRERKSQKGNKFAFAVFSDQTGQFEAVIFSDTLARARDLLEPGTAVLLSLEGERDGETLKLRVQQIDSLDRVMSTVRRGLTIVLDRRVIQAGPDRMAEIKSALKRLGPEGAGGGGEIGFEIDLEDSGRKVAFALKGRFDVSPAQKGLLSTVPGVLDVLEV